MSSVEPSVSLPGEVIRQLAPPSLACRMACGQLCRHEQRNFSNVEKKSIFDSLSANWVVKGELVAMARPSEDYLPILIPEMKSRGVNTVVNVQELNEHQYCGEIHRSGSGMSRPLVRNWFGPCTVFRTNQYRYEISVRASLPRIHLLTRNLYETSNNFLQFSNPRFWMLGKSYHATNS